MGCLVVWIYFAICHLKYQSFMFLPVTIYVWLRTSGKALAEPKTSISYAVIELITVTIVPLSFPYVQLICVLVPFFFWSLFQIQTQGSSDSESDGARASVPTISTKVHHNQIESGFGLY